MDNKIEISLLYDFYGGLLPGGQQQVVELYVNDDLSLSESADILGISRQGVRDALSRAKKKLLDYERRLGLLGAYRERRRAMEELASAARKIRDLTDSEEISALSERIEAIAAAVAEKEE